MGLHCAQLWLYSVYVCAPAPSGEVPPAADMSSTHLGLGMDMPRHESWVAECEFPPGVHPVPPSCHAWACPCHSCFPQGCSGKRQGVQGCCHGSRVRISLH
jgi:hypothetical protein